MLSSIILVILISETSRAEMHKWPKSILKKYSDTEVQRAEKLPKLSHFR